MRKKLQEIKPMFIAVEGPDGCGKSTFVEALNKELSKRIPVILDVELSVAKRSGKFLRNLIINQAIIGDEEHAACMLFLRSLDRPASLFTTSKMNACIINDRYMASTAVYQHMENHHSKNCRREQLAYFISTYVLGENLEEDLRPRIPDMTFFIDTDPSVILKRLKSRTENNRLDHIEIEAIREQCENYRYLIKQMGLGKVPSISKNFTVLKTKEFENQEHMVKHAMTILKELSK